MSNPLPPGPELDAKVATEVMGWRLDGAADFASWYDADHNMASGKCSTDSTTITRTPTAAS